MYVFSRDESKTSELRVTMVYRIVPRHPDLALIRGRKNQSSRSHYLKMSECQYIPHHRLVDIH